MKEDPINRKELSDKAGIATPRQDEPLIVSLLKQGGSSKESAPSPYAAPPARSLDPLRGIPEVPSAPSPKEEPVETIQKAHDDFDDIVSSDPIQNLDHQKYEQKAPAPQDSSNEYDDDDFGDDIDEILPEVTDNHANLGDDMTAGSQSMGLDPSVNTLAMEEYDHIEEVLMLDDFEEEEEE